MKAETAAMLTKALNNKTLNSQPIEVVKIVSWRKGKYGYDVWFESKDQDPYESNTEVYVSFNELNK